MNLEVGSSCSNMIFIFNFHSSEYFVWFEVPESGSGQYYQEFKGPEDSGKGKLIRQQRKKTSLTCFTTTISAIAPLPCKQVNDNLKCDQAYFVLLK